MDEPSLRVGCSFNGESHVIDAQQVVEKEGAYFVSMCPPGNLLIRGKVQECRQKLSSVLSQTVDMRFASFSQELAGLFSPPQVACLGELGQSSLAGFAGGIGGISLVGKAEAFNLGCFQDAVGVDGCNDCPVAVSKPQVSCRSCLLVGL